MLPQAVSRSHFAWTSCSRISRICQVICNPEVQTSLLNPPERRDLCCAPALFDARL